ncbi:tyrosine-protein kinase receptor Tie-1-like [Ptychodera flava]|uniref:tyrosine-protein kinase receptor Tie-1-like n=1 Tax=Ptychodera flava TaxID=63121 RepID=UPI00396A2C84
MLFEYMELGNLQDYLRKSRNCIATEYLEAGETSPVLTSGDLIIFAGQIASAMEYLSSKKCVHGDLATRNVMLNGGRICKVTNFGRDLRSHSNAKECSQRVRWMAPEAIQASEFSTKSDVWSFGVVVWEIVTIGHTPYPRMSDNEVKAYLKQGGRMKKPTYCDGDLYLLVMKCWSEKPKRRPKFKEIAIELEEMELDKENYIDMKGAYEDKIQLRSKETSR